MATLDIKQLQEKVKALANKREQVIRDQGAQEQKLEEAYNKLRSLGITDPEKLTAEELEDLATKTQLEFNQKVAELEQQIEQGEALLAKHQEIL